MKLLSTNSFQFTNNIPKPRHTEYDLDSSKCSNWQVIEDVIVVISSANYIASVSHTPRFSSPLRLNHIPIYLYEDHEYGTFIISESRGIMYQTELGCDVVKVKLNPKLKGIVSDSNNIILWHESEDINKKSLFPKFQLLPILRFQIMHDYV